jgi:hypothetical protein
MDLNKFTSKSQEAIQAAETMAISYGLSGSRRTVSSSGLAETI